MGELRIGTVDIPERVERDRYFDELEYLELSGMFGGPIKPSALAKWAEAAGDRAIGLVAPWVLTHRTSPTTEKSWTSDASVGDFRDSVHGRSALKLFTDAALQIKAAHVIFKSPPLFAPSQANRDRLTAFFAELAPAEAFGDATRVWIPDGLWEPRTAISFATELGVIAAIDPLVVDPAHPFELDELDAESLSIYFRVENLGTLRTEDLEDLAESAARFESVTIAFGSQARWADARNFKKLLAD